MVTVQVQVNSAFCQQESLNDLLMLKNGFDILPFASSKRYSLDVACE